MEVRSVLLLFSGNFVYKHYYAQECCEKWYAKKWFVEVLFEFSLLSNLSPMDQLETCCVGLISTKISERKRSAELLGNLLENKSLRKQLNSSTNVHQNWDRVVSSVNTLIEKVKLCLHVAEVKILTCGIRDPFHNKVSDSTCPQTNGTSYLTGRSLMLLLYCEIMTLAHSNRLPLGMTLQLAEGYSQL